MIQFPLPPSPREQMLAVAFAMYGKPYRWGGPDDDCSGYVQEVLASIGHHPQPGTDLTADAILKIRYARGQVISIGNIRPGCEAFWLSGDRATHIELVAHVNPHLCIGAGGGGSNTASADDFLEQAATWMKVPAVSRKKWIDQVNPVVRQALGLWSAETKAELANARVRIRPLIRPGETRTLVIADPWKEVG